MVGTAYTVLVQLFLSATASVHRSASCHLQTASSSMSSQTTSPNLTYRCYCGPCFSCTHLTNLELSFEVFSDGQYVMTWFLADGS